MNPNAHNPLGGRWTAALLGLPLVVLLALPLVALLWSTSPHDVVAGTSNRLFGPALWLSVRTTLISLAVIVATGTPLAWWLASSTSRTARAVELLVDLPIVMPPAVIGVALLQTFGRRGLLGGVLAHLGLSVPFSTLAVVIAQTVVAAPFYVQAAANAFGKVDDDLLIVARTLGASRWQAFVRVAVPVALPGLVAGASLAWARALGEFGATLLFAGNMTGTTQTMPLAIYTALQSNVSVAQVFSLMLACLGAFLLLGLRLAPGIWERVSARGGRR